MFKKSIYQIFYAALKAADPFQCMIENVRVEKSLLHVGSNKNGICYNLDRYRKKYIVGCGKAVCKMALAIEKIIGEKNTSGLVVTKYGYLSSPAPDFIRVIEAGHPVPDHHGYTATLEIIKILEIAEKDDLIIALISGGGSSLWALPAPSITLKELQYTTQILVNCGANISEINTVRKHISSIAGGFAACKAYPSSVLVLSVSDVIGNDLNAIASGPFFPDEKSFSDAIEILNRYNLLNNIPVSVRNYLIEGNDGLHQETPKKNSKCFKNVTHQIIASNQSAIYAANKCAEHLGFQTIIIGEPTCGEAQIAARKFCQKVINLYQTINSGKMCIIAGGETTVTLGNDFGLGGRNQEFALAASLEIAGVSGITILSCGTDGTDGPTDANGAVVDGDTYQKCLNAGINPLTSLNAHDSYNLFAKIGNLVKTGPTFTNVMDLQIAIVERKK